MGLLVNVYFEPACCCAFEIDLDSTWL